jgi:prophage DNA circulation protein
MTILAQLQAASFRGVSFLFNANNETGGRKSVVYEFPLRDKRTVTDLGKLLKTYKIKGIIKGSGEEYFQNRNQLIEALEAPGSGKLVHPIDGTVTVFAKPYVLNEKIAELGYAEFDLEFVATTEPIFPTQSQSQKSSVFSLIDQINSEVQSAFEAAWDVEFLAQNTINKVVSALDNVNRAFVTASSLVSLTSNLITPFEQSINQLTDQAIILTPSDISSSVNDSFSNLFNACQSPEDQTTVMSSFSQFDAFDDGGTTPGLAGESRQNTVSRAASNKNVLNISLLTNAIALNYNFAATTSINFTNEDEIIAQKERLNEQFVYIINNNAFKDLEDIRLPLLSTTAIDLIQNSKVLTDSYLRELDTTSHKINTLTVGRESIVPLVYKLYGSLDLLDTIIDLNQIGDNTNITGEIKVIEQ